MGDRIIQEAVQLGTNTPMAVQIQPQELVIPEDNIDENLFNYLKELKVEGNAFHRRQVIHSINIILGNDRINPLYVDEDYALQFGRDNATFFDLLDCIESNNEQEEALFRLWNDALINLLILKANFYITNNIEFDIEFAVDKVLVFGANNYVCRTFISRVSQGIYEFETLRFAQKTYSDPVATLFMPEVVSAIANLELDILTVMKLRGRFISIGLDVNSANDVLKNILSVANQQHVVTNCTKDLLKLIINCNWPSDFYLHDDIQEPEYFKLITNARLKHFVDQGYESLEFFLNLPFANLRQMINEPDLEVVLGLIGDTHDMCDNIHLAYASMPTPTIETAQVVVQTQAINSGLALNNPSNNQLER